MIVTSQPKLRAAIRHSQYLTCLATTIHQAAQARIYKIVSSTVELNLAWVRTQVLFKPKCSDVYRLVDSYVLHIHSQSSVIEELMLIISERVLEYGANRGKDVPTAQGMSVYRIYRLNMSVCRDANAIYACTWKGVNQYVHSYF